MSDRDMPDAVRDELRGLAEDVDRTTSAANAARSRRDVRLRALYGRHELNISQAARDMGVSRRTIHDIVKS